MGARPRSGEDMPESGQADSNPRRRNRSRAVLWLAGLAVAGGLSLWILRTPHTPPQLALPAIPDLTDKNEAFKTLLLEADGQARATGSAAALSKLARVYHANLFYTQAASCYELAAKLEPDNPRWPYLHAAALQSLGICEGVPELLRKVIELDEDNVPAWLRLADLELKLGQNEQARSDYQRILAFASDNPYAHLGMARLAMLAGDQQQARRHLEQCVKLDPHFGTAYRLLATVYEQTGEKELAAKTTATANIRGQIRAYADPWVSELDELCCDVPYLLTRELTRVRSPQSGGRWQLNLMQRLARYAPDHAEVQLYLGEALAQQGDRAQAGVHFREAVRLDPKNDDARCVLGAWLVMMGQTEEAEQQFHAARNLNPLSRRAALLLGMLRLQQNRPEDAARFLSQGIGKDAILPVQTISLYVDTLCGLGCMDDASKFLRDMIALRPSVGTLWVMLADVSLRQKDWAQAEQSLREGLNAAPYNAIIACRLAWVLATSPRATPASGQEAIRWAEISAETGKVNDPSGESLISLAAAYARAGRFDEAISAALRAQDVKRASGDVEAMGEIARQLRCYNTRQPFTVQ